MRTLPDGTVLDGEVVALRDGKPDFARVLRRPRGSGARVAGGDRGDDDGLTYVAFDVLYRGYEPLLALPLRERRKHLDELVAPSRSQRLVLSDGLPGGGIAFYRGVCERGLEGVVAKRLSSTYAPGKRNGAWVKIKRRLHSVCVVIGFVEKAGRDFQSLLVATNQLPGEVAPGALRYVGRVGGGFTDAIHARVNELLWTRLAAAPIVPCPEKARWIEAGLYCTVSFAELTEVGLLRAPVFEGLVEA
jgi:bifunctional non-homologous end joining protein LigD